MQTMMRRCPQNTNNKLNRMFILIALALLITGCAIASASTQTYTVQPGDTLAKIATAHDTTVERLVELNQETYPSLVTDPGAIEVGWQLKVPGSSAGVQVTVKKTPSLGSDPTATPMDRDTFEMEVVRLVNEERIKAGLAPLEVDPGLMQFARERSEDMVSRGYFDHNDPVTGAYLPGDKWENIASISSRQSLTFRLAQRFVNDWLGSEGHRRHILLSNAKKTGVGVSIGAETIIVTQLFAE